VGSSLRLALSIFKQELNGDLTTSLKSIAVYPRFEIKNGHDWIKMPMHSRLYSFRVREFPDGQENSPCPDCH